MAQHAPQYRLYGDHRSGNCYKAAWLLRLTGRAFEWVETDVMARQTRTEAFLALNPNGRVPLLVLPDGRLLSESNAMLLHLSEGTPWLPRDAFERAQVYQWLFFEQYSHEPYIAVARFIVHLAKTADRQPERMKTLMANGYAALGVMEKRLVDSEYLVAGRFSVADMALYAYTHTAEDGGFDLADYPAVKAWRDRVAAHPDHIGMGEACR